MIHNNFSKSLNEMGSYSNESFEDSLAEKPIGCCFVLIHNSVKKIWAK